VPERRRQRSILLLYALGATAWIVVTSLALPLIDPVHSDAVTWAEVAKGLLFVVLSTLFLKGLLGPKDPEDPRLIEISFTRPVFILAALVVLVIGVGVLLSDSPATLGMAFILGALVAMMGAFLILLWRERVVGLAHVHQKTRLALEVAEREAVLERERVNVTLRATLHATIDAIQRIVELRDPYTSGHQRRVGELAARVGTRLGMDRDRVEGLRMAGHVHDVGKITCPAEILAKPGALSAPELAIVRLHAEQGYEILKGLAFPWPLAEIVRQHHEHVDGTGYPRGLRGDAILLEAQIVGAASRLVSHLSHRPYRAALDLDGALADLASRRGAFYRDDVVDACLEVVRADPRTFDEP